MRLSTNKKESLILGKSKGYFDVIKCHNLELYYKYLDLGNGSLSNGYIKFHEEVVIMQTIVTKAHTLLSNSGRQINELLIEDNTALFTSEQGSRNYLYQCIVYQSDTMQRKYDVYKKYMYLQNVITTATKVIDSFENRCMYCVR